MGLRLCMDDLLCAQQPIPPPGGWPVCRADVKSFSACGFWLYTYLAAPAKMLLAEAHAWVRISACCWLLSELDWVSG